MDPYALSVLTEKVAAATSQRSVLAANETRYDGIGRITVPAPITLAAVSYSVVTSPAVGTADVSEAGNVADVFDTAAFKSVMEVPVSPTNPNIPLTSQSPAVRVIDAVVHTFRVFGDVMAVAFDFNLDIGPRSSP